MKLRYIIPAISMMLGISMPEKVAAQTVSLPADSTRYQFNALDYTLQKRYIPKGKVVNDSMPGRNFSISLMTGAQKIRGAGSSLPWWYNGGFAVTKEVSSFNAYRASLYAGINDQFKMGSLELAHLFNLSDYLFGWSPQRRISLFTVIGGGLYYGKREGEKGKLAFGLHGGLQMRYHLSQHWDWFIEPKIYAYTDGIDGKVSAKRYDLGYGANIGLTYRFTPNLMLPISENAGDNLFMEAAIGTQGDFSARVRGNLKGLQPLGPAASMSIGKWFMPIGVRATLFGGMHYTYNPEGNKSEEAYAGGRLEGMLNLNRLFMSDLTEDPRLEVNLSAGYELGAVAHRSQYYTKKIRPFHGLTAAGQLVWFFTPQIGLTGELRWNRNSYNQPWTDNTVRETRMQNLGVSLGIQYRRRKTIFDERRGLFQPYNFAYTAIGANFPVRTSGLNLSLKNLPNLVGQQVAIGAGRWFTPFSGVRGSVEIGRYPFGDNSGLYPLSITADYLFNLTNLIGNYSPTRIMDINAFAGLSYTHHNMEDRNYINFQGGLQQNFRVTDSWDIFIEETLRASKGGITPSVRQYTGARISFVAFMSIGTAYKF